MHHSKDLYYNKCGCDCKPKKNSHKKEHKKHKEHKEHNEHKVHKVHKVHKEHKCHKEHKEHKEHNCHKCHKCNKCCLCYYPNQQPEYAYTYNVERVEPIYNCYLYTKCRRQYFRCCYVY